MKKSKMKSGLRLFVSLLILLVFFPMSVLGQELLYATFDSDSQGFGYADDTFRGTNQPSYASGVFDPAAGAYGGGLKVVLGGVDGADIVNGMSGGWSRTFTLAVAGNVTIYLRYRLLHKEPFESDECGQALVAVDGTLLGLDSNDYLVQRCGISVNQWDQDQDTGWQQVTLTTTLAAGTHTLTLGGYLNKKTTADEFSTIFIDDVFISGPGSCAAESACSACNDGLDNDGDGQTDCNDADCGADPACSGPMTETNCSDGIDNDGDGQSDCNDADCGTDPACTGPAIETNCSDGLDNDSDGQPDCNDADCNIDPACSGDADGDGMPDAWENQYGLDPNANDRNGDADGDGISNWIEYKLGTDPSAPNDKGPGIHYEYDELGRIKKIERIPSR